MLANVPDSIIENLIDMDENEIVLYTRMSMKKEEGIERQRGETIPHLQRLGYSVVKEYCDDGKSATKDNVRRDEFEAIIELARARRQKYGLGTYTKVGCWHSDRFARRVKELLRVEEAGILIIGKNSGFFDLSTPAGVATAITVTAWAEYEGKQKALRQKAAHRQRAENGNQWWKNRPFGFEMDGTAHPIEAPILRQLHEEALAGASLSGMARDLNNKGITTALGRPWRPTTVRLVLMAPRNAGIITYNRVEIGKGNWEALVSEEDHRAVVRLLGNPARRTGGARLGRGGRTSLLSGFARCGKCNARCRVMVKTGYRLYICPQGHASAREEWMDERVESILMQRLMADDSIMRRLTGDEGAEASDLRAEMERLRQRRDEREEMFDNDEITREQFAKFNEKNRAEIIKVQQKLATIGLNEALARLIQVPDLKAHWQEMDVVKRHAVVTQFFSRIVIHPRGHGASGMKKGDVEFWVSGYDEEPIL